MPSIKKLLSRFNKKEREDIELLIDRIISSKWDTLDVKKLRGYPDIFRVRKGNLRIIYRAQTDHISILTIERRNEGTYKF